MAHHPTTDLVAVAWLKTLTGVPTSNVATTLPKDTAGWAAAGFVQVTSIGGTPNFDVPLARPVVQVDCWAVSPTSGNPPWGKANQLAEIVRAGMYEREAPLLVLPATYNNARVLAGWLLTEPRRIPDDAGSYARYSMDLSLSWVEVPK